MTGDKVLEVVRTYRSHFVALQIEPKDYPHNELLGPRKDADILGHCCGMLPKIEAFVHERRIEKAMRWLGFVQGCLWACGIFSLDELKNHSRPDAPEQ